MKKIKSESVEILIKKKNEIFYTNDYLHTAIANIRDK